MYKYNFIKSFSILAFLIPTIAFSQKLPNIQQNALWAPDNIKIDGKTTEWNDKFQAYNHATDVYYTICNDSTNLYLVLHAKNPDVLLKITNRGTMFTINSMDKKDDKNAVSISYPVFELRYNNKPYIQLSNTGQLRSQREAGEANPDSMAHIANKKLHDNEKFIRIAGISGVDTLLSVYNQVGIVARESFDSTMAYTYELSVPLKLLGLSFTTSKFTYHISLPGIDVDKDFGLTLTKNANGMMVGSVASGATLPTREHFPAVTSTTDFWGEYILAKK